jgi:hypothetical protein
MQTTHAIDRNKEETKRIMVNLSPSRIKGQGQNANAWGWIGACILPIAECRHWVLEGHAERFVTRRMFMEAFGVV